MRDKTASRAFRAKKKLDPLLEGGVPRHLFAGLHHDRFTRVPSAMAVRNCKIKLFAVPCLL